MRFELMCMESKNKPSTCQLCRNEFFHYPGFPQEAFEYHSVFKQNGIDRVYICISLFFLSLFVVKIVSAKITTEAFIFSSAK